MRILMPNGAKCSANAVWILQIVLAPTAPDVSSQLETTLFGTLSIETSTQNCDKLQIFLELN